jgi:hypothetical protein
VTPLHGRGVIPPGNSDAFAAEPRRPSAEPRIGSAFSELAELEAIDASFQANSLNLEAHRSSVAGGFASLAGSAGSFARDSASPGTCPGGHEWPREAHGMVLKDHSWCERSLSTMFLDASTMF